MITGLPVHVRLSVARREHNRCDLFRKPLYRTKYWLRNIDSKDISFYSLRKFHSGYLFPPVVFPDFPLFYRKTGGFRPRG